MLITCNLSLSALFSPENMYVTSKEMSSFSCKIYIWNLKQFSLNNKCHKSLARQNAPQVGLVFCRAFFDVAITLCITWHSYSLRGAFGSESYLLYFCLWFLDLAFGIWYFPMIFMVILQSMFSTKKIVKKNSCQTDL